MWVRHLELLREHLLLLFVIGISKKFLLTNMKGATEVQISIWERHPSRSIFFLIDKPHWKPINMGQMLHHWKPEILNFKSALCCVAPLAKAILCCVALVWENSMVHFLKTSIAICVFMTLLCYYTFVKKFQLLW